MESGVSAIEYCIAEQQACREYLDGDGPDKDGAMRGLLDWLMEECLIWLEGKV
jgi:hypothetical protein